MNVLNAGWAVVCLVFLAGCGRETIGGAYRDVEKPSVRYELDEGGNWSAEVQVAVPSGMFAHGAGRKFSGNFTRRGNVLELVCTSASRQDPVSGKFREEPDELSSYNHFFLTQGGALVAVGSDGRTESLFASDLNPFGTRRLEKEAAP